MQFFDASLLFPFVCLCVINLGAKYRSICFKGYSRIKEGEWKCVAGIHIAIYAENGPRMAGLSK